jgi:hypothetical protein
MEVSKCRRRSRRRDFGRVLAAKSCSRSSVHVFFWVTCPTRMHTRRYAHNHSGCAKCLQAVPVLMSGETWPGRVFVQTAFIFFGFAFVCLFPHFFYLCLIYLISLFFPFIASFFLFYSFVLVDSLFLQFILYLLISFFHPIFILSLNSFTLTSFIFPSFSFLI